MTGVIYARYSSDNQREESIKGQIRENTAFAEKNSIVIARHYIDIAVFAKTDHRPVDTSSRRRSRAVRIIAPSFPCRKPRETE